MAFVTVAHALHAADGQDPVLVETQNCILLGARPASRKATSFATVMRPGTMKRIVPDETLLFQYSALGFNSHKIHLDRNFARETEGFPDLVVNGGLATLLLTEFLRLELKGALTSLTAKHVGRCSAAVRSRFGGNGRMTRGYCVRSTTMASWLWILRRGHDTGQLATSAPRPDWDRR
jgi:hypothetical protein